MSGNAYDLEKCVSMPALKIAALEGRNVSPTKSSPSRSGSDSPLVRTRSSDISPSTPRAADPAHKLKSKMRESNGRGISLSKSETQVNKSNGL